MKSNPFPIIQNPIQNFSIPNDEETWSRQKPARGDHIRVDRGLYYHHGIYVSQKEVIHFNTRKGEGDGLGGSATVISTDLREFLKDGACEVKIYSDDEFQDLFPVEDIVNYARACLCDDGYNLVLNNCEHFANMCTLGRHRSRQVERVLTPNNKRGNGMGLIDFFKGIFGGGSNKRITETTIYEPDKVRVAEIENQTRLMLKKMEGEQIILRKDAQKELMECMTIMNQNLLRAKLEGYQFLMGAVADFNQKMSVALIERMAEIADGAVGFEAQQKINNYFDEVTMKMEEIRFHFHNEKLPRLLENLQKYQEDSAQQKIYQNAIEQEMLLYWKTMTDRVDSINQQRNALIEQNHKSRQFLEKHLSEMQQKTLQLAESVKSILELSQSETALLSTVASTAPQGLLAEASKDSIMPEHPVKDIEYAEDMEIKPQKKTEEDEQ